jgi:hypothetical protein
MIPMREWARTKSGFNSMASSVFPAASSCDPFRIIFDIESAAGPVSQQLGGYHLRLGRDDGYFDTFKDLPRDRVFDHALDGAGDGGVNMCQQKNQNGKSRKGSALHRGF